MLLKEDPQFNSSLIPVNKIRSVFNLLKRLPYIKAEEVSKRLSLNLYEINRIYKFIRSSTKLQHELKSSDNRDYFDTVNNHFGRKIYTVVFFVGLYCPARCHFCPSVKIHEDGYRELFRFQSKTPGKKKLNYEDFVRIFDDLGKMIEEGVQVNIKISGGLEPFTDPKTIEWILQLSRKHGINSTIFTNGMLLKIEKNRKLALQCDNLRVSLSTSDSNSYNEAYFGDHIKNKKVASLSELMETLKELVLVRNKIGSKTQLGINTVAGEFNFHELERLVRDISNIEMDYIEIKSDYFDNKNDAYFNQLETIVNIIKNEIADGKFGVTKVNLTGSLGRDNFFNSIPKGYCLPKDQVAHKLFINPFGECTPLHYWAYPRSGCELDSSEFIGIISDTSSLLDLIKKGKPLPRLDYINLNPFELILALESERVRSDIEFGIDPVNNPYISNVI
ncbi:radical SAM protein [Spartinivicinus ruber]|uniref:radical SAM protein n=1 Tax=Spartinivicinus ruber TaxID=2683272 RepID=UPI0013D56B02|nr:radical SAM protein [Spartinivicinus ruber]